MKQLLCVSILLITFSLFSQIPEYEFITEPTEIMMNFYDYMPGSYCSIPVRVQPDFAGGVYIVFHAREASSATRRIYYSYIDEYGYLTHSGPIGVINLHEGYPGVDVDPVSARAIVAWHVDYVPMPDREVVMSNSLYFLGLPGDWTLPFVIIDDSITTPNGTLDEFIWPEVHIGPSPMADKRRVYVIGKNADNSPTGDPSENVLIAFADFNENDFNTGFQVEWNYRTIPLLDQWHNGDPEWVRPLLSCSVSDDGQIALMGYIQADFEFSNLTDQIIVLHNDNYGEGDFEFYSQEAHYNVWYPGTTGELYFAPFLCNHQNSIFHDDNTKISFLGNMNLLIEPSSWYPDLNLMYPKVYTFDLQTQEFSFYDLYLEGADPSDDSPMIPWDYNEDGIVDSLGPNGEILYVEGWPIYNYDSDMAYHENNFKITKNEEKGWLAAVWGDGLKCRKAYQGAPGYTQWEDNPEIAICVSGDNGISWSQPIFLNALETPELADMIPVYVYPGDKIEDMGDNHGKIHLFFLNDYEYGPYGQGGINPGGMQIYCGLDIDFGPFVTMQPETIPQSEICLTNYPNPFNPSTTISFTAEDAKDAELMIYNVKGQKVKTFHVILSGVKGQSSIVWDGTDQNNKPVSSGVYFYKLEIDGKTIKSKKMLLLK